MRGRICPNCGLGEEGCECGSSIPVHAIGDGERKRRLPSSLSPAGILCYGLAAIFLIASIISIALHIGWRLWGS